MEETVGDIVMTLLALYLGCCGLYLAFKEQ